jgi:hypothetical protein
VDIETGEIRNAYAILVEKLKIKEHLEDLDANGSIILKLVLQKSVDKLWIALRLAEDRD